jgi:hypothetical protein
VQAITSNVRVVADALKRKDERIEVLERALSAAIVWALEDTRDAVFHQRSTHRWQNRVDILRKAMDAA